MENLVYDYPQAVIPNGETKTFQSYVCGRYNSLVVACKTDQSGIMYVDFSVDNSNWDSTLTFDVAASINEVHRITVTRNYFRVRFYNNSGAEQTYFRMQTIIGSQNSLSSPINLQVQRDADSIVTRPIDFNLMVADSLLQNTQITIKDGVKTGISTGAVTEDLWSESGVYAGFPTGTPEEGQIVVAGADTGTVWYSYLASSTSTDYVFASKAVVGAGNYDLGHDIYRCNFAYFVGSATNVSKITIRHKTTTANIFVTILAGIGQSYCAAYTVPFGSAIYIDRFNGNMRGSASGSLDGYIWYRPLNESPRLRFPFELQFGSLFFDDIDYLVKIPQQVDFMPRIVLSSANNLAVKFSYRLLKIKS
jgi:hypothetical protein